MQVNCNARLNSAVSIFKQKWIEQARAKYDEVTTQLYWGSFVVVDVVIIVVVVDVLVVVFVVVVVIVNVVVVALLVVTDHIIFSCCQWMLIWDS